MRSRFGATCSTSRWTNSSAFSASSQASQQVRVLSRLLSPEWVKWVDLTVDSAAPVRPIRWPALPRRYSSTAGFFFCGMMLEVLAMLSGNDR
ncbi:hypothetical protein LMG26840_03240 [Achromobacter dolens]|nr:hypothetical protein LMG26840_03240 [Achromobacter dolens]